MPRRRPIPPAPSPSSCPMPPAATPTRIARTLANRLEQRMGQPFVIEQRLGAASVIGATYVVARRARRLHDPDRHLDDDGDQCQRLQEPALRSDQGPRADRAGRGRAVHPGGQSGAAGEVAGRSRRLREVAAGRPDLCLERRRRRGAPVRGADGRRARDQARARALQGARRRRSTTSSAAMCR